MLKKMLRSVHVPGPDRSHRPSSPPMPSLTEHLKIEGPLLQRKDSYFVSCDKAVLGSNVTPQKMGISIHHSPKEKTGPCGYMTVFSLSSIGSLWVVRTPGLPGAAVTCPSLSRAETGDLWEAGLPGLNTGLLSVPTGSPRDEGGPAVHLTQVNCPIPVIHEQQRQRSPRASCAS